MPPLLTAFRRFRESSEGQSLVELALMTPILLTLLLGTVDLGRAFYALTAVANGAYNGAVYALVVPADCTGPVAAALRTQVTNELELLGTSAGNPAVTCTLGTDGFTYGTTAFTYAEVTVTYTFNTLGPYGFLPILADVSLPHTVRARVLPLP